MTGETRICLKQTVQTVPSGRVFQKIEAATVNERRPAVDRRYDGMRSCSVNDDRSRRRPDMLDTGTSWFRYDDAIPFNTRYAISSSLKSGKRSQCSIASASDTYSDEVGIPTKLRRWVRTADVVGDRQEAQQTKLPYSSLEWTSETTRERKQSLVTWRHYMTKQSECCETRLSGKSYQQY